jgi:prepilin-type N-terminal cleavage/methylation domain-containing protein
MSEKGFTLVEMIVSIVILSAAILALSTSSSSLARVALETETRALALQACEDRIATIRLHPVYQQLDSIYTENGSEVLGMSGYSRNTDITRIIEDGEREGKFIDFTRITVTVSGPGLSKAISRSVSIGQF